MRVIRLLPGPGNLAPLIRDVADSETSISALSDSWLLAIRDMLPEGSTASLKRFGKLVDEYLERSGTPGGRMAGEGYEVAAIAEACSKLPESSPFYACRRYSGAHRSIRAALSQLRAWNIDLDDLRVLAEQVDDDELADKLLDLAAIREETRITLSKLGMKSSAERKWLSLQCQPPEGQPPGSVLLIAGSEFEPLDALWIQWLDRIGVNLTVIIDSAPEDSGLFAGGQRLADFLGATSGPPLGRANIVAANLFAEEVQAGEPFGLRTIRMADPLAEAEWILRDALKKIAEGVKPSQLCIFCRNLASSYPLFSASAKRLGVPIQAIVQAPLNTNGLVRVVLALLESCATKDVRSLKSVLDSSYLGLSVAEKAALVEGLKSAYRTGELQWESLESWANLEDKQSWLSLLLEWRRNALKETRPLREWLNILQGLAALPWYERALTLRAPTREADERALSAMTRALAEKASIDLARGSKRLTLEQFVPMVSQAWQDETYHVPVGYEGVHLVGGSPESLPEVDVLYVTGMLEGVFPRRRKEDPILTDFDRNLISQVRGGPPLPTSYDTARGERDIFVRLCATPRNEIVLTYPLTDDNRDNVAAFYLEEARRAHGNSLTPETRKRSQLAPAPEDCISEADARLSAALAGPRSEHLICELQTDLVREEIRAKSGDQVGPRDWRLAIECPFHSAMQRKIRVRPKREARLWNRTYELPATAGLWLTGTEQEAEQALEASLLELVETVATEADSHDASLLKAGGRRLIRKLVKREFASREIWPRTGRTRPNIIFGEEETRNRVPLKEGEYLGLKGIFSAISEVNGYLIGHLVLSLPPKDNFDDEEPLYETTELGAYWAALASIGKPCGVEIETLGVSRILYIAPGPYDNFRGDQAKGLKVIRLNGEPSYGRAVQRRLQESYELMASGSVKPQPGKHCDRCDFGELCRSALGYGDVDNPFENPLGFTYD